MTFNLISTPINSHLPARERRPSLAGYELQLLEQGSHWGRQLVFADHLGDTFMGTVAKMMVGYFPHMDFDMAALSEAGRKNVQVGRSEILRQLQALATSLLLRQLIDRRVEAGLNELPEADQIIFDVNGSENSRPLTHRLHVRPEDSRRVLGQAEVEGDPDNQWYFDPASNLYVFRSAPASRELSESFVRQAARLDLEYDITDKVTLSPYVGRPLTQGAMSGAGF